MNALDNLLVQGRVAADSAGFAFFPCLRDLLVFSDYAGVLLNYFLF